MEILKLVTNLFSDWGDNVILLIYDLVDNDGKLMSVEQCTNIYEIKSNFLFYNGVISAIKSYQNFLKHNISIKNMDQFFQII